MAHPGPGRAPGDTGTAAGRRDRRHGRADGRPHQAGPGGAGEPDSLPPDSGADPGGATAPVVLRDPGHGRAGQSGRVLRSSRGCPAGGQRMGAPRDKRGSGRGALAAAPADQAAFPPGPGGGGTGQGRPFLRSRPAGKNHGQGQDTGGHGRRAPGGADDVGTGPDLGREGAAGGRRSRPPQAHRQPLAGVASGRAGQANRDGGRAVEVLGIDIGGTGVKAAPVDVTTGTLTKARVKVPTPQPSAPDAVSDAVRGLVQHFGWSGPAGITFPGVVSGGIIRTAANLDKAWIGQEGRALFARVTGLEVTVLNDADAAGVAEMKFGAGAGQPGTVLVLTFGTGIGSALFTEGVLVPNTELGHIEIHGK